MVTQIHERRKSERSGPRRDRRGDAVRLDTRGAMLGMGRSPSFPYPEWRDADPYRTVFFDEGEGHAIVFVHGLGGNATHWQFVLPALADDYRVVGLDLAGCGWSAKPRGPYTVAMLRDHLLSFLDRRGIRRATLVGHSMGGAVCLAAALVRPGLVQSLGLVCAAGLAPLPKWMRVAAPAVLHRWLLLPALFASANFIVDQVFHDSDTENPGVRWFRETSLHDAPGYPHLRAFARVGESLCRDVIGLSFAQDLVHLDMPVLALYGDGDKLTAVPAVLRQLDGIRRVRTVLLPKTGHMPMIERPAETVFHLRRLLEEPPA